MNSVFKSIWHSPLKGKTVNPFSHSCLLLNLLNSPTRPLPGHHCSPACEALTYSFLQWLFKNVCYSSRKITSFISEWGGSLVFDHPLQSKDSHTLFSEPYFLEQCKACHALLCLWLVGTHCLSIGLARFRHEDWWLVRVNIWVSQMSQFHHNQLWKKKPLKYSKKYNLPEQTQVLLKYISQSKCNSLLPTPGNIVVIQ